MTSVHSHEPLQYWIENMPRTPIYKNDDKMNNRHRQALIPLVEDVEESKSKLAKYYGKPVTPSFSPNPEKRRIDFSKRSAFSRDRIDNVLLGKKGIDSLQIQEFKPMHYHKPSFVNNERERSDSIWKDVFRYTKGCSDDHLNKFITLNLIKK